MKQHLNYVVPVLVANSREILKMMLDGKKNYEIADFLIKRQSKYTNIPYMYKALALWVIELGFKKHTELRSHLIRYGMPPGKGPILHSDLLAQTTAGLDRGGIKNNPPSRIYQEHNLNSDKRILGSAKKLPEIKEIAKPKTSVKSKPMPKKTIRERLAMNSKT